MFRGVAGLIECVSCLCCQTRSIGLRVLGRPVADVTGDECPLLLPRFAVRRRKHDACEHHQGCDDEARAGAGTGGWKRAANREGRCRDCRNGGRQRAANGRVVVGIVGTVVGGVVAGSEVAGTVVVVAGSVVVVVGSVVVAPNTATEEITAGVCSVTSGVSNDSGPLTPGG